MRAQRQKRGLVAPPPTDHSSAHFLSFDSSSLSILLFFFFFFTYKRSDTTLLHHLALKTLNAVTSQTLTSTFIRQDFKVSPQEPPSTMSQTALSKPPNLALHQRDSPLTEAASLNFLSLFRSTLMATQTEKGKKKSFPRLNSFLLFVKAFVHHLLLPYN